MNVVGPFTTLNTTRERVLGTSCSLSPGAYLLVLCGIGWSLMKDVIWRIRSPDDAKIKQKMLFASSKDALRRSLVGIASEIQGTDYSEVAYESGTSCPCPSPLCLTSDHNHVSTSKQYWRRLPVKHID